MDRRRFMRLVVALSADFLPGHPPFAVKRVDRDVLAALTTRTEALRVQTKETVAPIIASLEQHTRLLVKLFSFGRFFVLS